eukprot:GHVQ01017533.1.p1 GENE.GHVQ01017533.1~~GHVQ01017533.1.p1  ORF type:complete len:720 (+),score=118.03 GHVQ01017533.1:382-2541(+)
MTHQMSVRCLVSILSRITNCGRLICSGWNDALHSPLVTPTGRDWGWGSDLRGVAGRGGGGHWWNGWGVRAGGKERGVRREGVYKRSSEVVVGRGKKWSGCGGDAGTWRLCSHSWFIKNLRGTAISCGGSRWVGSRWDVLNSSGSSVWRWCNLRSRSYGAKDSSGSGMSPSSCLSCTDGTSTYGCACSFSTTSSVLYDVRKPSLSPCAPSHPSSPSPLPSPQTCTSGRSQSTTATPPLPTSTTFPPFSPTFRHNMCSDDWIAFPGRARRDRPQQMRGTRIDEEKRRSRRRRDASCDFCVGNEGTLPVVLEEYVCHQFRDKWMEISPKQVVHDLWEKDEACDVRDTGQVSSLKDEQTTKHTPLAHRTTLSSHTLPLVDASSSQSLHHNPAQGDGMLRVRVVPNKFPVVAPSRCLIDPSSYPLGDSSEAITDCSTLVDCLSAARRRGGVRTTIPAVGLHEVVIDHNSHSVGLGELTNLYWQMLFTAFRDRGKAMAEEAPLIQTILFFKNEGAFGGASISHPHSQLVGLPVVPQAQVKYHEIAREYFAAHSSCLFCDYLKSEIDGSIEEDRHDSSRHHHRRRRVGSRVVDETDSFVAVVPFAAHIPYHLNVFPKRHWHQFIEEDDEMLYELGVILQRVFLRLDLLFEDPDYNLVLRNTHLHRQRFQLYRPEAYYHWHVEIFPRLDSWPVAGFEFGTGIMCNSHLPEDDAAALRTGLLRTTRIW